MWVAMLAMLLKTPVLELPHPVPVTLRFTETRVFIEMAGEIQDPVKVFAPQALETWVNQEKMTCRRYGGYRWVTFPILHNQEACEPY
ncbi:MAG: hypothetical protein NTV70_18120 [Acidobacteria bacterium]|nr:hypothetical protein [Acidobacteriota bacterium]